MWWWMYLASVLQVEFVGNEEFGCQARQLLEDLLGGGQRTGVRQRINDDEGSATIAPFQQIGVSGLAPIGRVDDVVTGAQRPKVGERVLVDHVVTGVVFTDETARQVAYDQRC